jgi:hypothetical protein
MAIIFKNGGENFLVLPGFLDAFGYYWVDYSRSNA